MAKPAAVALGGAVVATALCAGCSSTKTVPGPTSYVTSTRSVTVTATPTVQKVIATRTVVRTRTYTPPPQSQFTDGLQLVGTDIPSGTYKTDGQGDAGGCYYAILNSSDTQDIDDNNNITGPARVTLRSGKYFETSGGCSWQRVS